jgi:amino acid permease
LQDQDEQPIAQGVGPDGQPVLPSQQVADVERVEEFDNQDHEVLDEDARVPVTEDGLQIDPNADDNNSPGEQKRVRRLATIMNLLNSLLGAGILAVPKSLSYTGVVPSMIILVIIAILSHIGTVLTIKLQFRTGAKGLDDLALKVTKKPGQLILSILTMIFCYSAMVGYLIIGGKILKTWLELANDKIKWDSTWIRALTVLIYSLVIPVALILPRSIAFLSPFSFITVISICLFFVAIIIKGCMKLPNPAVEPVIAKGGMGVFSAISIYALAFALPIVVLPIVEPYNPDVRKRGVVSAWTCVLCFILVAVPAVIGYLMFGDKTADSILDNFANDDVLMIIVRIGFFFVVSFSYPCLGQSCLASWSMVFYKVNQHAELPTNKRAVVLLLTNAIPIILACFLPDASPVLGVGGALGGCIVDFFYPALIWVMVSKRPWTYWKNLLSILFTIVGIVLGVICTYQSIVDAVNSFK